MNVQERKQHERMAKRLTDVLREEGPYCPWDHMEPDVLEQYIEMLVKANKTGVIERESYQRLEALGGPHDISPELKPVDLLPSVVTII
jgi:hypothetical protein